MANFVTAWRRAERNIFDWLKGKTGDTENVSCAIADVPPTHDFATTPHFWEFSMSGGTEPLEKDININTPGECQQWQMDGQIRGVWTTRAAAQDFFGTISQYVPPADTTITAVQRLQVAQMPTLEPIVWDREITEDTVGAVQAAARGGPRRVWMLTIPVEVIFDGDT